MLRREGDYVDKLSQERQAKYLACRKALASEIEDGKDCDIFHYTSAEGFYNIIRNRQFFLTDVAFLNDSTEMANIAAIFKETLAELKGELCDGFHKALLTIFDPDDFNYMVPESGEPDYLRHFVLACSYEKDSLSLWNYYTKDAENDGGYNLSFRKKELVESFHKLNNEHYGGDMVLSHGRIVYEEEKKKEMIRSYLIGMNEMWESGSSGEERDVLLSAARAAMKWISIFFKHSCFSMEREYRVVLTLPNSRLTSYLAPRDMEAEPEKLYKVRFTNNMFAPYVKMRFLARDLKGVYLSPLCEKYTAEYYLRMSGAGNDYAGDLKDVLHYGVHEFLRIQGYDIDRSQIMRSEIPLRF